MDGADGAEARAPATRGARGHVVRGLRRDVRGLEAAQMITRTIRGEIRPTMAICQLPIFWSSFMTFGRQP